MKIEAVARRRRGCEMINIWYRRYRFHLCRLFYFAYFCVSNGAKKSV
jgi:hypothetical protein